MMIKNLTVSFLTGIAMIFQWAGQSLYALVEMIDESEMQFRFDEEEEVEDGNLDMTNYMVSPHQEDDGYLRPASAESEQIIREIVSQHIEGGAQAKNIVIGVMGMCRALNTMASAVVQASNNKTLCCEAAGIIAVTSTCERMLRSVTAFDFIEKYQFIEPSPSDDED